MCAWLAGQPWRTSAPTFKQASVFIHQRVLSCLAPSLHVHHPALCQMTPRMVLCCADADFVRPQRTCQVSVVRVAGITGVRVGVGDRPALTGPVLTWSAH